MPLSLQKHVQSIIKTYLIENVSKLTHTSLNKVDPNISLFKYGFDSIHFQELISQLEEWTGLTLSEDFPTDCHTINKLSDYITHRIGFAEKPYKPDHRRETKLTETIYTNEAQPADHRKLKILHKDFSDHLPYLNLKKQQIELAINQAGHNIFFDQHQGIASNTTVINDKKVSSYASYNYLGMSGNPLVSKAAILAIKKYGTSVSASRLVSGEKPLHRQLEKEISSLIGTEDSIVFNSGYVTNLSVIGHLFGPKDLICYDEYAHNSLIQGTIFSTATRISFPHNDWQALDKLLSIQDGVYERALIILEGVYSMDGDIPNLPQFINIKNKYKAMLMIDEAHSIGVLGETGGGIGELYNIDPKEVEIWMGTLSKAFGSCGGYIAGNQDLIDYLKYTCPGFVYSVGITPPDTAAALAAIQIMKANNKLVSNLHTISQFARNIALSYGFDIGTSNNTPIIPIIVGDSKKCIAISFELLKRDINIKPVIHPAVPEGLACLRLFLTTKHTKKQVTDTFNVLKQIMSF